jgi:di/tricarboxylate transporter
VIAFNLVPVSLAALLAGAAAVIVGAETIEQARQSIRWQVLFLIGGMLPLASALEQTGAASFMIGQLDGFVGSLGPRGLMLLFFGITALLAQFTSGQAATLIAAPLALSSALGFGVSARTLMMAVAIGASTGFLSPVSHPANLLVMGPGGYKFGDYAKLGFPLVIVATLGVALLTPLFYPF